MSISIPGSVAGDVHNCLEHPERPNGVPGAPVASGAGSSNGDTNGPRTPALGLTTIPGGFEESSNGGSNAGNVEKTGETEGCSGVRGVRVKEEWEDEF
jgi:hypothetical protein